MSEDTAGRAGLRQEALLVLLRIAIGWHLLYEGLVKVLNPGWTAAAFLAESRWLLSEVFRWIAEHPAALKAVDFLNAWGLTLIGLSLLVGAFSRQAAVAGIALLALYYLANPPLASLGARAGREGSYLVVDKNLVELLALGVVAAFPVSGFFSLERRLRALLGRLLRRPAAAPASVPVGLPVLSRRELVRSAAAIPALGCFGWAVLDQRRHESLEERELRAVTGGDLDTVTSATVKAFQYASLKDLKGQVPHARIGSLEISRVIMGGNLIGGWAHARDLLYVSKLVKTYHSDQKVFETLRLAERCGINTLLTNPQLTRVIRAYWRHEGGAIQFVSDCGYQGGVVEGARMSIAAGAHACYVHGGMADDLAAKKDLAPIRQALDVIRRSGRPAGIGAHKLETVQACVDAGLSPDFWVKTLHECNYWSARKDQQNDNIWCVNPEETAAYMSALPQPWIAYKVLAAGAIEPAQGFRFAFRNGADFICVGMYDFQVVEDVNVALSVLADAPQRPRRWLA